MRKTVLTIATGLGTGYSPVAPGTAGSLLGLAAAYLLTFAGWPVYLAVTVSLFALGVWASGRAEVIYGEKDCGRIVIDEVAGMLISLAFVPVTPLYYAAGFFLFRFFDIVKPFPARRIDQTVEGGMGVMLDDAAAALYTCLCLHAAAVVA